ncbi:MAG: ABC transporter substrate-binding protein [Burkholderiales bacterium]|nr:ABC transporter substrate-binding protein [Burkholderiales bacterium]
MRRPLLAALIALAAASAAQAQAPDWKKIRIGVEGAYPPFSEVGPDGKLKGFDIDIANALCAQLKAECTQVQQDFDAMIPALNAKKIDAVIASMSITPERQKQVDFSNKYYSTPARFVAKADAKLEVSAAGLKGRKIGVQRSTIHDRFATDTFKQSQIVRYAKQDEVFLDLASGRIDGALLDSVAADEGFLKLPAGKGYAFFGPQFTDPKYFGVGAGIAIRKGEAALQKKLNDAIAAIRADGSYKKLQDKYFAYDVYGADPAKK